MSSHPAVVWAHADRPARLLVDVATTPTFDMRTYRGPNTTNDQTQPSQDTAMLGEHQVGWLQRELNNSRATWKVICSDMPVGLVPDGTQFEAWFRMESRPRRRRRLRVRMPDEVEPASRPAASEARVKRVGERPGRSAHPATAADGDRRRRFRP